MPRRNKKSLKAISQHIESGKGFGSLLFSSSDPATGDSAASEEDFVDLVGDDDDDICFNEENQSSDCEEVDEDEILTCKLMTVRANRKDYERFFNNEAYGHQD